MRMRARKSDWVAGAVVGLHEVMAFRGAEANRPGRPVSPSPGGTRKQAACCVRCRWAPWSWSRCCQGPCVGGLGWGTLELYCCPGYPAL